MKKQPKGDYPVGYAKPPSATRFKKGQSGNRAGRPKKKKAGTFAETFDGILGEEVTLTWFGKPRKVSRREAIIAGQIQKALSGDLKALNFVLPMAFAAEPKWEESSVELVYDLPEGKYL